MSNAERVRDVLLREYAPEDVEKFFNYHREHPRIFIEFKQFALQAYEAGIKTSAKAIVERLRWEIAIERSGEFKISNTSTALYARTLAAIDPRFETYFKFKTPKGIKQLE